MRNKLFQEALDNVPEETRQKVQHYMDMVGRIQSANDDNAIGFAKWLNTPFKHPNGNGTYDIRTRCIAQYPDLEYYIMHDNEGNLNNKVFYKIEELYQVYLKTLKNEIHN